MRSTHEFVIYVVDEIAETPRPDIAGVVAVSDRGGGPELD
jgi:hypothetical protein